MQPQSWQSSHQKRNGSAERSIPQRTNFSYNSVVNSENKKLRKSESQGVLNSLFRSIDEMSGWEFESFTAALLTDLGFENVAVTPGSNDQGVDVIAFKNGAKYAVQCKKYSTALGNKPVQEVATGRLVWGCDKSIVITNNFFTKGAHTAAQATQVELWDRRTLANVLEKILFEKGITENISPYINLYSESPYLNLTSETSHLYETNTIICDNVKIEVDIESATRLGIGLDEFSIVRDSEDPDCLELLFDVRSLRGSKLSKDIEITLNAYGNNRKLCTESENVYTDKFHKRSSRNVYFARNGIARAVTRIEIFCNEW